MPTNREITFTIRMRNAARAAVQELNADLQAQGTTLKQVARQLQDVQSATARLGTAATQADRGVARLAASAKTLGDAAKNVATFAKSIDNAAAKTGSFGALEKSVTNLDKAFTASGNITAYHNRLSSLQATLAALTAQYNAATAAAAGFAGTTPPRAPRGSGSAGAPPQGTAPPSNPSSGSGGNSGGSSGNQQNFNKALAETRSRLDDIQGRITQLAALTVSAFGARKVLELADAYNNVMGQLKLVTSGTSNLKAVYEALLQSSNDNHTSIETSAMLYSRFTKATQLLGVSQREVVGVTDAVNKAISIFGGNAQSAEAALVQFSQGLASGTLRGEELNSVLEQAPRLAQAIADGMKNDFGGIGIPIGSLRAYAEQGKLTTEEIFKALQRSRPKLEAEMNAIGVTLQKAFVNAKNEAIDFVGKADEASGASKRIAEDIIQALKVLQTPQAILAAQTALSGFASALNVAFGAVKIFVSNFQLIATAFVAFKAITIAPILVEMAAAALLSARSFLTGAGAIGVYTVATRSLAVGATAAQVAMRGLALVGGPLGAVIAIAATALTYWLTQTKSSVEAGTQLSEVTDKLRTNYDAATNSVKNLTEAEKAREKLKLEGARNTLSDTLKSQADDLTGKLSTTVTSFIGELGETVSGSYVEKRFAPFRQEIGALQASIARGKPEIDAFQKAISTKAGTNKEWGDAGRELLILSDAARQTEENLNKANAGLKVIAGTATETETAISGVGDALKNPFGVDGNNALTTYQENLKKLRANIQVLGDVAEWQDKIRVATTAYTQGLQALDVAYKAHKVTEEEFLRSKQNLEATLSRAKDAIIGYTQSMREMGDQERALNADVLVDRARAIEQINIKYDQALRPLQDQLKALEETKTATNNNAVEIERVNALIERQNQLRRQDIGNIDVRFQNNDLRDRVISLQTEARLLGTTGEARERASKLIEVENAARRAGVSDIQGMVNAYAKEYDALKKAEQARQTMGNGLNAAVTQYIETTSKVGDESQKMFSSMFDNISNGFVDVIKTGQDGFKSLLDNLANDILRFASRQLFRALLSSIFGDGQGGISGGAGGFGGSILSAIGLVANNNAKGATSVAQAVAGTGVGSTVNTVSAQAASGIVSLSNAATSATDSFGDIPSKLTSMLKGLGASDAGVAGFLGNVQSESGFNPNAVNGKSGAYGLIQALGPRKDALFKQFGSNPTADQQIEFIKNELQTTEKSSLKMLQSAVTVPDGVKAGIRFERPEGYVDAVKSGDLSQVPDFNKRLGFANGFSGTGASSSVASDTAALKDVRPSDESVSKLNGQFDSISTSAGSLDQSISQVGSSIAKETSQITDSVKGASTAISSSGSNVGDALTNVSTDVSSSGNGLVNAISKLSSNLGGGGIGSLFSKGDISASDFATGSDTDWLHTGGIIGQAARVSGRAAGNLWSNAPKFHTGGIVGGLKSRERAIIAKDDEAIFPTVRMSDGNFGIRATGFTGGGGGGASSINFGDINIQTTGSSGNAQADAEHQKGMAREVKESIRSVVREELLENTRSGGLLRQQMGR